MKGAYGNPTTFSAGHSIALGKESGKSILENRYFNSFFNETIFNFQVLTRIILSTQCFALCNQNVTALIRHFNRSSSPK